MNHDCLFCRIAAKEIPAYVIYEDEHALAFLDIMPRTAGHTVVIPKNHVSTLLDVSDEALPPLFAAVKTVDGLLSQKLGPDGMTIGINQGKAGGQEVGHLHIHCMPRWHGDGGGSVQSVVRRPPKETVEAIFKKIVG